MTNISRTSELSLSLADSKLERLSNILDISTQDNELTSDDDIALKHLEAIENKWNAILNIDPSDLFIAIYYAYSIYDLPPSGKKPISFKELSEKKNLIRFDGLDRYFVRKLKVYIDAVRGKDVYENFFHAPYKNNILAETHEYHWEKIREENLEEQLNEYQKLIRQICAREKDREFFALLISRDMYALVYALLIVGYAQDYNNKKINKINNRTVFEKLLNDAITTIQYAISQLKEKIEQKKKENKKQLEQKGIVDSFKERLCNNGVIRISSEEFGKINSDYAKTILECVLWHNRDKYISTIETIHSKDKLIKLKELFNRSCFQFDNLSEEQANTLVEYVDLDYIQAILASFTETNGYNNSFPIYDILLLSNREIVIEINKLIQEHKISILFVLNNPEIFIREIPEELQHLTRIKDAKYLCFRNNLASLENSSINTYQVSNSKDNDVFLMNSEEMKERLELINLYKLQYDNSSDYSLFFNPKLINIVDAFIELGLGEFIKNHPEYICESSKAAIDRIRICKANRMKIEKNSEIERIIKAPQFVIDGNLISDEELGFYIPNAIPLYANDNALGEIEKAPVKVALDKEIPELEEFKKSALVYKINGITISRQKVLRNISILENSDTCKDLPRSVLLFNALVCGSVFDNYQLTILSNAIVPDKEKLENNL